ncbi:MAG: thiamine pyrophosphate-dependent enzyme [Bacillota bacterium]|nr:thiamine pyrophosphate-dependent enzyme [Bacillota bacterium]
MNYCPGCTHGIIHRLVAEAIDALDARERTIGVASVGCSVFAYNYFECDMQQASHGRAPAVATGIKRVLPDRLVFTYQGDGDLASIGAAEIVHAAARGENITVIFVNNANYGMTGGQMAPTTLLGQKTTTTPLGRDPKTDGFPIRMAEMLATLQGPAYIARVSVHSPQAVKQAGDAIKKAFRLQAEGKGFTLIEVLSTCPTNWGLAPNQALKWLVENLIPFYPLGEFKKEEGGA